MKRRQNHLLTTLIVLFCAALLAGAGYMLVQVLPKKAPQEVSSLETNSVFESEQSSVAPEREQAYEGEIPSGVEMTPDDTPEDSATAEGDNTGEETAPSDETAQPSGSAALISAEADALARKTLASMSQDEKIWQLFYVTPELLTGVETATRAGDTTKTALEEMPVGGIIYFAKNLEDRAQTQEMLHNTKAYTNIPLFLGTDEEGGTVSRVGANPAMQAIAAPSAQSLGEQADPAAVYQAGQDIGGSLHAVGFNMDFAPVADVSSGPSAVIGSRSFGTDAQLCASLVSVITGSLRAEEIIPCLKHFPGYGSAITDDHYGTSILTKTLDELEACDFLPFASGIEAGAPFVMVSHLSVPEVVGDNTPSDLSEKIVTELLRNKLGFTGVIITDSHQMASITDLYQPGEAAVKALQAGVDMILMPQDLQAAFDGVKTAIQNGTLSASRIDESVLRILQVKAEYGILK